MRGHPDSLTWSRFLGRELGLFQRLSFARHLRDCDRCRARRDALSSERAAFERAPERERDLDVLLRRIPSSRPRPRPLFAWGLAAAAAVVVVFVAIPREDPAGDLLRAKGGSSFELWVKQGDGAQPLGDECRPGDALRASHRTAHRYLLVLGRDGTGTIARLFPSSGPGSARLEAGDGLTPGSWVLDDRPGVEQFIAFFSDDPISEAAASAAIRAAGDGIPKVEGAEVRVVRCRKSAP